MSNIINKVKEAVTGHSDSATTHSTHNTTGTHTAGHNTAGHNTAGPHSSDIANKVDPRVDSDRDGSRTAGGTGAYGSTHNTGSGLTGSHSGTGLTGSHNTHNTGSGLTGSGIGGAHGHNTTAGPHSSDMANKIDPRVDSDRDGSRTAGGAGGIGGTHNTHSTGSGLPGSHSHTTGSGLTGSHNTGSGLTGSHNTGSGLTGSHNTGSGLTGSGTHGHNTAGPHSSDLANKVDPRVDSDRDGSRTAGGAGGIGGTHSTGHGTTGGLGGTHSTGHGTTGGLGGSHTAGHNTTGTHSGVGSHGGPGPAPHTAGPHKSDLLNKLDPRVDSNLDGSKTIGGDKTFSS